MGGGAGFRNVVYYVNWAIYGRDHLPTDLPADQITHVLYSFANVKADSGEVYLTDEWADVQKHFEGDSWSDTGENVYGCIGSLFKLKKKNRNFKVLLSIGGWTYSSNFGVSMSTEAGRLKFAQSAVKVLEVNGFDGIDIDWEYPKDTTEAQYFVDALKVLREELKKAEAKRSTPTHFLITVAVSAGPTNFKTLKIKDMDQYLDFWNLMAYDYAGSWETIAGHQANWYTSGKTDGSTPFSTDAALRHYLGNGVVAKKMVVGLPMYGRAFAATQGPGSAFNGVGEGSWEKGIWDYKALPKGDCQVKNDVGMVASWCYDTGSQTMISYDSPEVIGMKADLIKRYGFGGGMWWESSGDKAIGQGSLLETFVQKVGGKGSLEQQNNCLEYPESKYDNIKNGSK